MAIKSHLSLAFHGGVAQAVQPILDVPLMAMAGVKAHAVDQKGYGELFAAAPVIVAAHRVAQRAGLHQKRLYGGKVRKPVAQKGRCVDGAHAQGLLHRSAQSCLVPV